MENGGYQDLTVVATTWPTPEAHAHARGPGFAATDCHYKPHDLATATDLWRTPMERDHHPNKIHGRVSPLDPTVQLAHQAELWHTPHGMSNRDHKGKVGGCGGGEFAKQANNWPTPVKEQVRASTRTPGTGGKILSEEATIWQTPATDSFRSRSGDRKDEMGLDQQARFFPTPAARDYRTPNKQSYQERSGTQKGEQLQNFVEHRFATRQDPETPSGHSSSPDGQTSRRRLNPRFVEWLMGFPISWTEL